MKSIIAEYWYYAVGLLIVAVIGIAIYSCRGKVHYKLYYEKRVRQTVQDMVKPECLKSEPQE